MYKKRNYQIVNNLLITFLKINGKRLGFSGKIHYRKRKYNKFNNRL